MKLKPTIMNAEKLKQMQEQVRIGGKGSVRRKKKIVCREHASDDKRVQSTLKKIGLNEIPCIDEVTMMKTNGDVMCFNNPKLLAMPSANTFAVIGHPEIKTFSGLWPNFFSQLQMDSYSSLFRKSLEDSDLVVAGERCSVQEAANPVDSDQGVPDLVENVDNATTKEL